MTKSVKISILVGCCLIGIVALAAPVAVGWLAWDRHQQAQKHAVEVKRLQEQQERLLRLLQSQKTFEPVQNVSTNELDGSAVTERARHQKREDNQRLARQLLGQHNEMSFSLEDISVELRRIREALEEPKNKR